MQIGFDAEWTKRNVRVELSWLELGGLQPVLEGRRARVMRVLKEVFAPAPVPQRP